MWMRWDEMGATTIGLFSADSNWNHCLHVLGLLWHTKWICYMSTPNSVWDLGQACYHLRPQFHWGTVPMIILGTVLRWDFLQGFVSNTTYVHWSDPVKTYMSWTPRIWCKKSLDKIEFQQTTSIESRQHRTHHFLLLFAPQPATPKQVNATPTRLKATTRVATSTASEQPSPMAYQTWVVEKHVKFEPLKNIHILGKRSF